MSETPVPPPASPSKEVATTPTTTTSNAKKFEGDGVVFKAKLIGMEDLSIDRDEKICLDSMFKLKAVVRARGEHKQKIQINLTMSAVKIIDDITKVFYREIKTRSFFY
jgi:disabled family protein 2